MKEKTEEESIKFFKIIRIFTQKREKYVTTNLDYVLLSK